MCRSAFPLLQISTEHKVTVRRISKTVSELVDEYARVNQCCTVKKNSVASTTGIERFVRAMNVPTSCDPDPESGTEYMN